jgi:hypothetical protein
MDAPELRDVAPPEGGIDFTRLREIRAALKPSYWCYLGSLNIDGIYSLHLLAAFAMNMGVYLHIFVTYLSVSHAAHLEELNPFYRFLIKYNHIRTLEDLRLPAIVLLTGLVVAFTIRIIRNIQLRGSLLRKLELQLEESNLLSRILEATDDIVDIGKFTNWFLTPVVYWPIAFNGNKLSEKKRMRVIVHNLEWYVSPAKMILSRYYLIPYIRSFTFLTCTIAVIFVELTFDNISYPGILSELHAVFFAYVILAGGLFSLMLIIEAFIPNVPDAHKAHLLYNKLKPVFELLGPDHGGR